MHAPCFVALRALLLCRRRDAAGFPPCRVSYELAQEHVIENGDTQCGASGRDRYARPPLLMFLTGSTGVFSEYAAALGVNWCAWPPAPQPPHLPGETAAATRHRCRPHALCQVRPCPCPHTCTHYKPLSCCVVAQAADASPPAYETGPPTCGRSESTTCVAGGGGASQG